MATANKLFEKKLEAFFAALSSIDFMRYEQNMSSLEQDKRYWLIVLKKSISSNVEIKVWDTKENKWINTIETMQDVDIRFCCIHYDHTHQLIMLATHGLSQHRGYIYNFFKPEALASPALVRAKDTPAPIVWHITHNGMLVFNDDISLHVYSLDELKNNKDPKRVMYNLPDIGGYGITKIESVYSLKYILWIHPKITVFLVPSPDKKHVFNAWVVSSTQEDPVYYSIVMAIEVKATGDITNHVSMDGGMLSIGNNKLDVTRFI